MDTSEHIRREQELEIKRQSGLLEELYERVKQQDTDHTKFLSQIKYLTPFEAKYEFAEAERLDLKDRLHQV